MNRPDIALLLCDADVLLCTVCVVKEVLAPGAALQSPYGQWHVAGSALYRMALGGRSVMPEVLCHHTDSADSLPMARVKTEWPHASRVSTTCTAH